MAFGDFALPRGAQESARVSQPKSFYEEVLDNNPQITLPLVQQAAEAIAGPICVRAGISGVRWDDTKDKFVFAARSDAKVVKDRWGKGLRDALNRQAGATAPRPRLTAVESAVRLAVSDGIPADQIRASVERALRERR